MAPPKVTASTSNDEKPDVQSALGTVYALKGHFTRNVQSAERLVTYFEKKPTSLGVAELEKSLSAMKVSLLKLSDQYILLSSMDPDNAEDYSKNMDAEQKRLDMIRERIVDVIRDFDAKSAPQASQQPDTDGQAQKAKPNTALKPKHLTMDVTPVELRHWFSKFRAYFSSSHFELSTVEEQQAYLFACLDDPILTLITPDVPVDMPVFVLRSALPSPSYTRSLHS